MMMEMKLSNSFFFFCALTAHPLKSQVNLKQFMYLFIYLFL